MDFLSTPQLAQIMQTAGYTPPLGYPEKTGPSETALINCSFLEEYEAALLALNITLAQILYNRFYWLCRYISEFSQAFPLQEEIGRASCRERV